MKVANQSKATTSTRSKRPATITNSTATMLSAFATPFQNAKLGNNDMLPALIEEQSKAARDLENYIAEFARKLNALQTKPGDAELVILFVMNLQPRWKRLVEPLEPTFSSWAEAAQAARYHSAKMSALLGISEKDNKAVEEAAFTFFGSKESERLLTSGYFVPDSHPRKADFADREQPATKKDKVLTASFTTPQIPLQMAMSNNHPSKKNKKTSNSGGGAGTSTPTTSKATASKKPSAPSDQQQYAVAAPSAAMNDHDLLSMFQENVKQEAAVEYGTSDEFRLAKVYDRVPPEHRNVYLPFLELDLLGQRVSTLLAKNRWGASVMSLALLKKLKLRIEPDSGCDIATEFGLVTESIGSTFLPLQHPGAPEIIMSPLEVQVLPKLYGGKVDLILGADFFFCFDASFNDIDNRKIRFMNRETTFIAKELK